MTRMAEPRKTGELACPSLLTQRSTRQSPRMRSLPPRPGSPAASASATTPGRARFLQRLAQDHIIESLVGKIGERVLNIAVKNRNAPGNRLSDFRAFNLVGAGDIIVDYYHATALDLPGMAGQLGAAYAIPILYVPLLMITHGAAFYLLARPSRRPAAA